MSGELASWIADDPEAGATRVGGRPVQSFWMLLRPSFRWVFVAPHRRAGGAVVAWRWSAPATLRTPEPAELADLRSRLKNALTDFTVGFERREGGAASGAPPELLTAMRNIVRSLLQSSDAKLGEYAVRSDAGLLIRSWGFSQPSPAKLEGATDSSQEANSAVVTADEGVGRVSRDAPHRRRYFGLWFTAIVVVVGLMGIVIWFWLGAVQTHDEAPPTVSGMLMREPAKTSVQSAPTGSAPRKPVIVLVDKNEPANAVTSGALAVTSRAHEVTATGTPLSPPTFSPAREQRGAAQNTGANPGAKAGASARLPGAVLGVMPTLPERPEAEAGPKSTVAGQAEAMPSIALPEGGDSAEPEPSSNPKDTASSAIKRKAGATVTTGDGGAKSTGSDAPSLLIGDHPSAPVPAIPRKPKPRASTVEAKGIPLMPDLPPPLDGKREERSEKAPPQPDDFTLPEESGEAVAKPNSREPSPPSPSKTSMIADLPDPSATTVAVPQPETQHGLRPQPQLALPDRGGAALEADVGALRYAIGPWRVGPAQDRVLPTWPTERPGKDALAEARSETLRKTEALCPESFRNAALRSGLSFRPASDVRWSSAPTWIHTLTGNPVDSGSLSLDGLRLSWGGRLPAVDFDVRLMSVDGRVLARVWLSPTDRRIQVATSPDITEVAPWFSVELTESEAREGAMVWRSQTPSWSFARWETGRDDRSISVTCHPASPEKPGEALQGVIALVHPARGWALSWDVSVMPVQATALGERIGERKSSGPSDGF